jgi:hypothetical protein
VAAPVKTGPVEVVGLKVARVTVRIVGDVEIAGVVTIEGAAEVEDVAAAIVGAVDVEDVAAATAGAVEVEGVTAAIVGAVEVEGVTAATVGAMEVEELAASNGFESDGQYGCKAWNVSTGPKLTWQFFSSEWHIPLNNINRTLANGRLTLLVGLRALPYTTHDQLDKAGIIAKTLDILTLRLGDLVVISVETLLLYDD